MRGMIALALLGYLALGTIMSSNAIPPVTDASDVTRPDVLLSELSAPSLSPPRHSADIEFTSMHTPAKGAQKWVNILCKFADRSDHEPRPREWFDTLMGPDEPHLGHYWSDVSYGALDIRGSTSVGWFTLPSPRSQYVESNQVNGGTLEYAKLDALAADCTAQADPFINFNEFSGINLMFNGDLDGSSYGALSTITYDGTSRAIGMTWLPEWGFVDQMVIAREMGHAMGLHHSSGPYDTHDDSEWDLMSGGGSCQVLDATYGCIGIHPIAYQKDVLGWIPDHKKLVVAGNAQVTVEVEPLSQPTGGTARLLVEIPIQHSSTISYTIEARHQAGYDRGVPGDAIVIHRVDRSRLTRAAQVVDPDGNGNPNDSASMWLPGETFSDPQGEVSIRIDGKSGNAFIVTITTTSAIDRTWARADYPIAALVADRTWMWGPQPVTAPLEEPYWDSPNGQRTVIYFDKSRMEITDLAGDNQSIWYVTNGLLVVELITGRLQYADDAFDQYEPSLVNVAGDADDPTGPTYASFLGLLSVPAAETPTVTQVVHRDGSVTDAPHLASYGVGVVEPAVETGHVIAQPFWEFMTSSGVIWEGAQFVEGSMFQNAFYATGLPVTAPYWANVKVGGVYRDVLIQCFERRCLTYTPGNPEGWQVEAGNVGLHYYHWRYVEIARR